VGAPSPDRSCERSDQAGSLGTKEEPSRPAALATVNSPGVQQEIWDMISTGQEGLS
jgi:hypothetical protein